MAMFESYKNEDPLKATPTCFYLPLRVAVLFSSLSQASCKKPSSHCLFGTFYKAKSPPKSLSFKQSLLP